MNHPNWPSLRASFPALEKNTYLNTASGGVLSAYARSAARQYYDEAHTQGDILWDEWLGRVEDVRAQVAAFLNAEPEEIAFLPNASLGLNHATHLFEDRDRVLTTQHEFPSDTLPWLQQGYPVDFLSTNADGSVALDSITKAITPSHSHLVTSSVQYQTGYRFDLHALGRLCQENDLTFIVDATQGIGVFPIDVEAQKIDVLVFSGYKWATAGYGIGVLYIRKDLLAQSALPMVGWRSARDPYTLRNDTLDVASKTVALELGHPLFPGIFALGGSLRFYKEIGFSNITKRVLELTTYLHHRLSTHDIPILSTLDPTHQSGITMIKVDDPITVVQDLKAQGIYVAARGQGIRVSVHFYNNRADIDRFVDALRAMPVR